MGKKGQRQHPAGLAAAEALVEQLASIGGVTSKRMFGGVGIFHEGKMFGLVNSSGEPYLKGNDVTQPAFEAAGSSRHGKMPYWRIPADVLNDTESLITWAEAAIRGAE